MSVPHNRAQLVARARSYVGTRYADGGRLPGVALDCLGILLALAAELGRTDIVVAPYGPQIDPVRFRAETRAHLIEITFDILLPADIMTFDIKKREQHYGFVTGIAPMQFVHAYSPAGRVVEQPFDAVWRARLRGCWRLPGID